jgi:hypothetical protein
MISRQVARIAKKDRQEESFLSAAKLLDNRVYTGRLHCTPDRSAPPEEEILAAAAERISIRHEQHSFGPMRIKTSGGELADRGVRPTQQPNPHHFHVAHGCPSSQF